jgi:hypothetical protein
MNQLGTCYKSSVPHASCEHSSWKPIHDQEWLNEKVRKAAREICSTFDVKVPRGYKFANTREETIAIIIACQLRELYEESK